MFRRERLVQMKLDSGCHCCINLQLADRKEPARLKRSLMLSELDAVVPELVPLGHLDSSRHFSIKQSACIAFSPQCSSDYFA